MLISEKETIVDFADSVLDICLGLSLDGRKVVLIADKMPDFTTTC